MRAMVFDRYGDPDVMSVREVPVPEPQDGAPLPDSNRSGGCLGVG